MQLSIVLVPAQCAPQLTPLAQYPRLIPHLPLLFRQADDTHGLHAVAAVAYDKDTGDFTFKNSCVNTRLIKMLASLNHVLAERQLYTGARW